MTEPPLAETSLGVLRGEHVGDGVAVFRGVRYGEPTGGANRFRAPVPATPWRGVADATRFGPSSPPTLSARDLRFLHANPLWSEYAYAQGPVSEDCLRLNVWTGALDPAARRPVLVWLHGGGFSFGSGSSDLSHGDVLARDHDLVVVTVNHRLGILGHLSLEAAGPDWADSGVAGLLDLRLALTWVRDNIAAFGGDPSNVTIVGHSGGGAKVASLLAMPSARGLFRRAVIQSGVVSLRSVDRDEAAQVTADVAAEWDVDVRDVERLQSIPVGELTRMGGGRRFRPVVGGPLLPEHPFDPVAAESTAGIPLLIGTTTHDTATFKFDSDPEYWDLDDAGLVRRARLHPAAALGGHAETVVDAYRHRYPGVPPAQLLVAITSDRLRQRTDLLARRMHERSGAPVYLYEFTYEVPMPGCTPFAGVPMSQHGLEIPFVFGIADRIAGTGDDPAREELARAMSACWAAFCRDGVPAGPAGAVPAWPAFTAAERATMMFGTSVHVATDPDHDTRGLFESLGA